MRPNRRTLIGTANQSVWTNAVKTDVITLPKDFALQKILLDINGKYDVTTSGTLVQDAGPRTLIQVKLSLTGGKNGTKVVYDMSGVDCYIKNFFDYKRAPVRVTPNASTGTNQAAQWPLVLDFRLAHVNPDDFGIAIPLYALSSADLTLAWDTIANGIGSGTYANVSLTANITLFEGIPETDQEKQNQLKAPLMTVLARQFTWSSQASGDEPHDTEIVVGNLIRRIFLILRASGGTRSDTEINNFVLGTADTNFINRLLWSSLQLLNMQDYYMPNLDGAIVIAGVGILDFARAPVDQTGNVIGLNTIAMKSGDLKLTVNRNAASSVIRYVQEQIES